MSLSTLLNTWQDLSTEVARLTVNHHEPPPDSLTPAEESVLRVFDRRPLTAKQVAKILGRVYNSNLRALLARLIHKGKLKHGCGRYRPTA